VSEKDSVFRNKLLNFIKDEINPNLAAHGGWIEVKTINENTGVIEVTMGGGCHGCAASALTVQHGIKTALMQEFSEITEVVDVTEHATGENPFFMGDPFK
jgi:Fe-S cluster biogenesis protein NfuA